MKGGPALQEESAKRAWTYCPLCNEKPEQAIAS